MTKGRHQVCCGAAARSERQHAPGRRASARIGGSTKCGAAPGPGRRTSSIENDSCSRMSLSRGCCGRRRGGRVRTRRVCHARRAGAARARRARTQLPPLKVSAIVAPAGGRSETGARRSGHGGARGTDAPAAGKTEQTVERESSKACPLRGTKSCALRPPRTLPARMAEDAPAGDVMKMAIQGVNAALRSALDSLRSDVACVAARRRRVHSPASRGRRARARAQPDGQAAGRVPRARSLGGTAPGLRGPRGCDEPVYAGAARSPIASSSPRAPPARSGRASAAAGGHFAGSVPR